MSNEGATPGDSAAASAVDAWRFPNRATPPGSSAYYSIRLASARHRDALAALYGWRSEVRSVLERVSDPGVARIKLDWWRSEIARTLSGAPRHPLTQVLAQAFARKPTLDADESPDLGGLPESPFFEIIASTEEILQARTPPDRDAQRRHDEQDLGALFELLMRCEGGGEREQQPQPARRAGAWCAQVRRIRDAGWLLRRGRPVFSGAQLTQAGVDALNLASATARRQLPDLLRTLAEQLWQEWPPAEPRSALTPTVRVQVSLHRDLLRVLERSAFDVTDQRISLTPLRKLWLAWRATR